MRRFRLILVLALVLAPAVALAQASEERRWSVETGLGFMADPDAFLMGFEGDYRLTHGFSLGAEVQLGIDDDFTVVSPTARARYSFDLRRMTSDEALYRLRPFVQSGVGFTYITVDAPNIPGVDDDDIGFLCNFGFGAEYLLDSSWSVGSKMLFNVLPGEVFGESFYYSWEVASLRYRF
jgi:opacity protein-like surface antigen